MSKQIKGMDRNGRALPLIDLSPVPDKPMRLAAKTKGDSDESVVAN
jgi:hypothetical protein